MLVQHDMCPTKMSPCSVTFDTVTAHSKVHMCNIQKDIRHNHPSTTWVSSQSSPYWGTVWGISSSPSWQLKSLGGSTWESVTHSPWHMWPPGTGEFWDPTGSDTCASFSSRNAFDLLSDLHGDWKEGAKSSSYPCPQESQTLVQICSVHAWWWWYSMAHPDWWQEFRNKLENDKHQNMQTFLVESTHSISFNYWALISNLIIFVMRHRCSMC